MADTRKDLPAPGASNWGARVNETLRTYLGKLGSFRDQGVTFGDLVDAAILKVTTNASGSIVSVVPGTGVYTGSTGGSSGGGTGGGGTTPYEPDLTPPPTPTGFEVDSGLTNIFVSCDPQLYTAGHGHDRTNVYGLPVQQGEPLPTFSDAVLLYSFQGTVSSYAVNPNTTYHLWIKWQSVDGVESSSPSGGINGKTITTGQDVAPLLALLTGQLTTGMLDSELRSHIDKIDSTAESLLGTILTDWENVQRQQQQYAFARNDINSRIVDGLSAEATQRTILAAGMKTATDSLSALIVSVDGASVTRDQAITSQVVIAQSQVNQNTADIETNRQTAADATDAVAKDLTKLDSHVTLVTDANVGTLQGQVGPLITQVSGLDGDLGDLSDIVDGQGHALTELTTTVGIIDGNLTAETHSREILQASVELTKNYILLAVGSGGNAPAAAGVYPAAGPPNSAGARSWNTFGLSSTGLIIGFRTWDVYAGGTGAGSATDLANTLAAQAYGTATVFFTTDEPLTGITPAMRAQLVDFGATGNAIDSLPFRGAYILVGYKGAGEGGGMELVSPYGNAGGSETRNWLQYRLSVINGWPAGLGGPKSALKAATAAVAVEASARATETGYLGAQYTVRLDVAGLVSGFGLSSTSAAGASATSAFGVRANQFYVAPPAYTSLTDPSATQVMYDGFVWLDNSVVPPVTKYRLGSTWTTTPPVFPFVIQTTPTTINGVAVPPGVYMSAAFIINGTITNAKIGNLQVDDAKIANLNVSKLTAGSLAVGEYAQSTGFISGSTGWRINGNGNAEFAGVVVRGTVYATAGEIGGITIYSNSIQSTNYNGTGTGFRLRATGDVDISGTIRASAGSIGGNIIGASFIRSSSYVAGSSGWNLNSDGTGQLAGLTVYSNYITSPNWVFPGTGWALLADGRFYAYSGDFGGSLMAATGTFSGVFTAAAINAVNTINVAGNAITVPGSLTLGANTGGYYNHGSTETISVAVIGKSNLGGGDGSGDGGGAATTFTLSVNGTFIDSVTGAGGSGVIIATVSMPPGNNYIYAAAASVTNVVLIGCKR